MTLVGENILGYQVRSLIGEGGMGAVYRGVHPVFGQEVAIKVLDPVLARDPDLRERFVQEARIQMGLRHQGIVQVLTGDVSGDRAALVMELVDGVSLEEVVKRRGFIPADEACGVFAKILDAVGYAHSCGVVHRDLKPSNILLTAAGEPKVLDFGIAKVVGNARMTRTGTAMGSPHYMSPEQVLGKKDIDQRSDVYSLGATFYEALTGRPPFAECESADADSDFRIKEAHVHRAPADPRTIKPEIPEHVAAAVLKALAKDPEERFPDCSTFARALAGKATAEVASAAPGIRALSRPDDGRPLDALDLFGAGPSAPRFPRFLALAAAFCLPQCAAALLPLVGGTSRLDARWWAPAILSNLLGATLLALLACIFARRADRPGLAWAAFVVGPLVAIPGAVFAAGGRFAAALADPASVPWALVGVPAALGWAFGVRLLGGAAARRWAPFAAVLAGLVVRAWASDFVGRIVFVATGRGQLADLLPTAFAGAYGRLAVGALLGALLVQIVWSASKPPKKKDDAAA